MNITKLTQVMRLLDTTSGEKVSLATEGNDVDVSDKFIAPTMILNPKLTDPVVQDEIFGPLMPIFTWKTESEAIELVHKICDSPLALYIYS